VWISFRLFLPFSQGYIHIVFVSVLRVRVGSQTNEKGDGDDDCRSCLCRAASSRSLITASERGWCAQRVESRVRKERVEYVDREARAASEASIELASFPVATALKPPLPRRHRSPRSNVPPRARYNWVPTPIQDVPKLPIPWNSSVRQNIKTRRRETTASHCSMQIQVSKK